jgi:hypothetical protein
MGKNFKQHDNSNLRAKLKIRRHFLDKTDAPKILECYGAGGEIYKHLYKGMNYTAFSKGIDYSQFNYFDLDAYSDPSSYLRKILMTCEGPRSIVITDNNMDGCFMSRLNKKFYPLDVSDGLHLSTQHEKLWFNYFKMAGAVMDFKWFSVRHTYYIGCQVNIKKDNVFNEVFAI